MGYRMSEHRHRRNFFSTFGYCVVVLAIVVCLVFIVKHNRTQQAEREAYKEELSSKEYEEDIGDISITMPTNAPDNAAGKDSDASGDETSDAQSSDAESEK